MPRVNVLVHALDGRTRCVECDLDDRDRSRDLARVVDALRARDAALVPYGARVAFSRSARARGDATVRASDALIAHVTCGLLGGKGGFGTQLRASARRGTQTTNFDACRDLSGRRLRAVNGEKKIAAWEAEKAERDAEAKAEKYLKSQAGGSGAARLRELEEKEREAYHAESAKVSESVNDAVASGFKNAAAIEAAKRKKAKKGKAVVGNDDESESESESDEDFDDSALLFPAAKKARVVPAAPAPALALANEPEASTSQSPTSAPTMAPPVMEQKEEGPLDLTRFDSAEALEAVGLERLKAELTAQKLKCGGTLRERAARLFLLRDNTRDEIDKKHWSK